MTTARVKWVDGFQFVGESGSGHAMVMDAPGDSGGNASGMTPMEMLLVAIGGCSGMDVASVLKKKKLDIRDIEIKISGEMAGDYPKKFTGIQLEFIITGSNLPDEPVKKAVDLSINKYCSVKATLEGSAKIGYTYRIINI
jgi:putative redox protein